MHCGVEERVVRSIRMEGVKCFKCGEEGHKSRMCPLKEYRVAHPYKGKAHQEKKPAHLVKGKAQECREREVRRVEKKAARPVRGEAQQGEWRRSSMEELRKRAEEHCREDVPEETQFFELGWCVLGMIVTYTKCRECGMKGSYVEDDRGQGVLKDRTFWCGCKGKKIESGAPTERKSAARVEKAARPERQRCSKVAHGQENRKVQQGRGVVERRSEEPLKC